MRRRYRNVLALCMLLGCGSDDDGASPDGGVDAPGRPTRTVTGHMMEHHVTAPGEDEAIPVDLSGGAISAFIPDTMTTLPGSGNSDGSFRILGVPEGEYYLRVGNRYIARTTDTVDLDYYEFGRTNARPATTATTLYFNVTELAPWQTDDTLELFSPTSRTAAYSMHLDADGGVPTVGATSLTGFAYDLSLAFDPGLPNAQAGDRLTLTQLATQRLGAHTFQALARAFKPTPFTIGNGDEATVTGAFETPTPVPFALTWDRPAFDAELRAHSPGDEADTLSFMGVYALPDADRFGHYSSAPALVRFDPGYTLDSTALTTTDWSYGDPFPSTWTRFVLLEYYTYQFIGDAYKLGSISQSVDLASLGSPPIQPSVGLPVDVMINGRDAFTAQTGVGATPTISWSAPTIGTVDKYLIRIYEITDTDEIIARNLLETTRTSIMIPPNLLMPGTRYSFEIVARAASSLDAEAQPFRDPTFPSCFSRVSTAFVTP